MSPRTVLFAAALAGAIAVWSALSADASTSTSMTAGVDCDSTTVVAGTTFQCSMTIENSGSIQVTDLTASGSLQLCSATEGCCVCILPGFPLAFVSADPRWTSRSQQYGFPFWEPLGSGSLSAGDSITIHIVISAGRIGGSQKNPDFSPAVCVDGRGTSSVKSDESASDCAEISIVDPHVSDLIGDADCSGAVDSRDALLVLQHGARLIIFLACPWATNINGDANVDALDAALILQYSAGLLASLSP